MCLCRLHPFSVGELVHPDRPHLQEPDDVISAILDTAAASGSREGLDNILQWSGFPEPLFAASPTRLNKWQLRHRELIIREDLRDLSHIRDIGLIDSMIALLCVKVSSVRPSVKTYNYQHVVGVIFLGISKRRTECLT